LLSDSVFNVFVDLTILVEEPNNVRAALGHKGRLIRGAASCYVLHGHQDFVDTGDVFLDLGDVVLQDGHLNALGAPQAFHYGTILVSDVFLDNILEGFNLVDAMVKSNDLGDKLGTLGDDTRMNGSVDQVKAGTESLLHGGDTMQLGVMRAHNCAIITNQLLTGVAEVSQGLIM
jgi:hypothetical protein